MAKPSWYDNAAKEVTKTGFEALKAGGHKCVVKNIEVTKSKSGLDMWIIYFDTTKEDEQPLYFTDRFKEDTRPDKKWGGRQWYIIDQNAESNGSKYGQTNLARFMTAVEESNSMVSDWNYYDTDPKAFAQQFINKRVGIVFREEEYTKDDGQIGYSVKPMRFTAYAKASDAKVPARKELPSRPAAWAPAEGASGANGFMQLVDNLEDEGLPFNV